MRASAALLSIVLVTRASAQPDARPDARPDRARELYEQGERAYNVGRFADAAQSFQAAYLISGQAGLLFNIAQSYRQGGDCGEALRFYRSYLRAKPDGDPDGAVTRRIGEMAACAATKPQPPAPSPPATAPTPIERADEPRAWLPWAFAGGGVALIGGGAALYGWTTASVDDCAPRCSPARLDSLHVRADVAYAVTAIGGVSLVAAGWLWWRHSRVGGGTVGIGASPGHAYVWGVF